MRRRSRSRQRPTSLVVLAAAAAAVAFGAFGALGGAGSDAYAAADDASHTSAPLPRPRIHLLGTARIDAHAARASGKLVLSGTVLDDTGKPLPQARVLVSVSLARPPSSLVPLASAPPEPCGDYVGSGVRQGGQGSGTIGVERADLLALPTDDAARFCVRLALPVDRYVAHLEMQARASGLFDAAKLDVPIDLALLPVTLRFAPERPVVSLDEDKATFDVVASTEDDSVTTAAAGLPLTLSNETGAPLGTATTDGAGRARFVLDAVRLGSPGRGELRVAFAGSADAGASTNAMPIERRTRVDLLAPDANEGTLPAGSPEDGIGLQLVAQARCARRGCLAVPTGMVEARAGEAVVGAAPLERGATRVVATFTTPSAGEVSVSVHARYLPDAPWFEAGGELALEQPVRPPSPWRRVPLLLAGLIAVGWLIVARMPRGLRAGTPKKTEKPLPPRATAEAHVELVRAGPAARGWTGSLLDAHDGGGIAGARIAVERRSFEQVEVVAQTATDAHGAFALQPLDARPGDELVAEGRVHAVMRRPLPPPGELHVALVLRKRALLDRLVAWARRRGRPYDAGLEPTPGHVMRAAGAEFAVARWADAVERAVYGGGDVDARAQAEVDEQAPDDAAERAGGAKGPPAPPAPYRAPRGPR